MDSMAIASAFVAASAGRTQMAAGAAMLKMNAQSAAAIVELLEAAQANMQQLAPLAAGVGGHLDISV